MIPIFWSTGPRSPGCLLYGRFRTTWVKSMSCGNVSRAGQHTEGPYERTLSTGHLDCRTISYACDSGGPLYRER